MYSTTRTRICLLSVFDRLQSMRLLLIKIDHKKISLWRRSRWLGSWWSILRFPHVQISFSLHKISRQEKIILVIIVYEWISRDRIDINNVSYTLKFTTKKMCQTIDDDFFSMTNHSSCSSLTWTRSKKNEKSSKLNYMYELSCSYYLSIVIISHYETKSCTNIQEQID